MDVEQKAQVTELYVPMDCRGCVHKIKRALHNLDGVYEIYIDVTQQKLTVVGRVEPEKIVKVIKKTRKTAAICPPPEPPTTDTPPPPPPAESTTPATAEAAPAAEDPPKEPPPAENPSTDIKTESESKETAPEKPKTEEQIHMIHYYPQNSIYRERWNAYPRTHEIRHESFPNSVIQNLNGYRTTATQRYDFYGDGSYQSRHGGDGGQITSMFSEENPNACAIV